MSVTWYERYTPSIPAQGWRSAIGIVQSDWSIGEHSYDAYVPITLDLLFGLPVPPRQDSRNTTFFVELKFIIDSRVVIDGSAIKYEGLSGKYKYGEACIQEGDVVGAFTYLNFSRQLLGTSAIFTPNVTRAFFPETPSIIPLEAETIILNSDTNLYGQIVGITSRPYTIFSQVRIRAYDSIETRATVYYRAYVVNAPKQIASTSIIAVFAL